jgi:hypothetical protein
MCGLTAARKMGWHDLGDSFRRRSGRETCGFDLLMSLQGDAAGGDEHLRRLREHLLVKTCMKISLSG